MTTALPAAIEAEQQVIGALLIEPALLPQAATRLRPVDIHNPYHRAAFNTLQRMQQRGIPVDIVSIKQELATAEVFKNSSVTPTMYLANTGQAVATVAHLDHYVEQVAEASRKRKLHDIGACAMENARNGQSSSELLADLGASIEDLRRDSDSSERFTAINAAGLDGGDFALSWLVDWMLVEGQPCILAGPKKALKTSLLLALFLALAIGAPFLGKFNTRKARRVLFCSGESGLATLQETARRIAGAMGWELADVPNFAITTDLPRLNSVDDLAAFESFLEGQEAEVVAIDPTYLCMGSEDSGNLFAQGAVLLGISQLCQRLGVTLILCHHTKRHTGRDSFDRPELEDIAWAGFQEFARQWLLVGRRERYEPGSGMHRLWLSVGGSAGHSGLWALDIEEGTSETPGGRYWNVALATASEAHEQAEQRKSDAKQQKQVEQLDADVDAVVRAVTSLPNKEGTKTQIRDASGLRSNRFNSALAASLQEKHLEPTIVKRGNNREYDGYRLADSED